MNARATQTNNAWIKFHSKLGRLFGRRMVPVTADIHSLDDRLLKDIGLRRIEQRSPQCLGDYHPNVVAMKSITKDVK